MSIQRLRALAAFAVSAALCTTCGSHSLSPTAPTSANSAAPVARLSIPIEGTVPFGIQNQTALAFDASASTGVGLQYRIEFGDGEEASASVAYHVGTKRGVHSARLTVTDSLGRTDSAEVSYATVSLETFGSSFWWGDSGREVRVFLGVPPIGSIALAGANAKSASWTVFGRDVVVRTVDGMLSLNGQVEWIPEYGIERFQVFGEECLQFRMRVSGGLLDGQTMVLRLDDSF